MMESASDVREHHVEPGEDALPPGFPLRRGFRANRLREVGLLSGDGQFKRIALVVAVALASFGGAVQGTFHLDDYALGELTPIVRPLSWLTFQVDGAAPWSKLAVNVGLHAANAVLALLVVGRLAPALVFAAHPFAAEPVNYIFARPTLLAAFFLLLLAWDWKNGQRWRAVAWCLMALASKEDALAAPLILLLWERRFSRPLAAMFASAAVTGMWSVWAAAHVSGSGAGLGAGIAPLAYLQAQGAVLARYLMHFFVPWGFTLDPALLLRWAWLGWMAVAAALWFFRRNRHAWTALLLLLPSSSIVPLRDLSADRRMYLSTLSLAAMVPGAAAMAATPVLVGLSMYQTSIWRTEERLWRWVVEHAEPDAVRPRLQLSRAVPAPECLTLLAPLEAVWSQDWRVPAEMGRCALQSGQPAAALKHFGRALALKPNDPALLHNRDVAVKALFTASGQTAPE